MSHRKLPPGTQVFKPIREAIEDTFEDVHDLDDRVTDLEEGNIKEITSTYSTLITDANLYLKGNFNLNLHSLSIATRLLTLKVALQGDDTITLLADGSDLIEGASSYVMNSDEGLLLLPTSDGWEIV